MKPRGPRGSKPRPPPQVYTRGSKGTVTVKPRQSDAVSVAPSVPSTGSSTRKHSLKESRSDHEDVKIHVRTVRKTLDEISRAPVAAVTTACELLDHWDEDKHNLEVHHHISTILARRLQISNDNTELRMLCAALEMTLRGSTASVQLAFQQWPKNVPSKLVSFYGLPPSPVADVTILAVSKIFLHLSRCERLRAALGRLLIPAVLYRFTKISAEARVIRARLLSNLANCNENKFFMYDHVKPTLMSVMHHDPVDLVRQHVAACWIDLPPDGDENVWGMLVKTVIKEKSGQTREFALAALQNVAYEKKYRTKLVEFREGIVLETLLKSLKDQEAKARRRAAGVLTNLVGPDTTQRVGEHKGMLETLALAASSDSSKDVQSRAALCLTKIATHMTPKSPGHDGLLDALVAASLSKADTSISAVLRVKARDPAQRLVLARHSGVLDTLCDWCLSQSHDRSNAVRALMHLVNDPSNRRLLCTSMVLDALVHAASYKDMVEARDSAIVALERLATEVSNRCRMARHPQLITVVAQAVERESVWEEDGLESEHGYLAKPLLLSLLVAM